MECIEKYEAQLNDIYQKENILCLSDWESVKFDNKNALQFISDNCLTVRNKVNSEGIFDTIVHDLIFSISQDIKFSLGNIYLYKELGINNFLNEHTTTPQGETIFTYRQTLGDSRFFFYVNVCFEKLYNFWDRIGDLLSLALDLKIKPTEIYFPKVIREIEKINSQSINFKSLKEFSENEYQDILNRIRKLIVHYRQKDTDFRFAWLKNLNNEEGILKLQQEKDELLCLLKDQMHLTIDGFRNAILLINES